ncbi:MAG: thioredoxin-like domain-containing protein [Bdellovibrionota bacterium]
MKFILILSLCFGFDAFAVSKVEGLDIISQEVKVIDFSNLKDSEKGTVVLFLSPLCPCSEAHTGTIKALMKEYKDFKFVGIYSSAEENEEFREYFRMKDFGMPVLRDAKYTFANELGALSTPHAFVINKKGEILYKGGVTSSSKAKKGSDQLLNTALKQIEEKKEVSPKETRVLGCAIRDT